MTVRVLPCGPAALLAEVADAAEVAALHAALLATEVDGIWAVVPAARTVLVEADPIRLADIHALLERWQMDESVAIGPALGQAAAPVVEVPVVYDGADLDDVAAACGIDAADVVRRHSAPTYTAAFCGFSPGFAYLIGGDPVLQVPRRAEPRTRVPAGSVAIAGEFSAVYPSASPGGWHLLGHTTLDVWSVERVPPALVTPGTRVRFRPVAAT